MANTKEQQLQTFARRAARVSRALWPTNVRRAIATGRVAQTRRRLIVTGRYWSKNVIGISIMALVTVVSIIMLAVAHLWLPLLFFSMVMAATFLLLAMVRGRVLSMRRSQQQTEHRSFPGISSRAHSPNTPMPLEPPLVRVLETFDLSQTDVEHFFELPEGGNTGGYSLKDWKEAQTSLPRTVREQ